MAYFPRGFSRHPQVNSVVVTCDFLRIWILRLALFRDKENDLKKTGKGAITGLSVQL